MLTKSLSTLVLRVAMIICGRFQLDRSQQGSTPLVRSPATAPILITTALMALGWIITMTPWLRSPDIGVPNVPLAEQWLAALVPAETPVTFAFLGAYFFGLQLLFRRYVRRDLRGSALDRRRGKLVNPRSVGLG